jgi:DNA-binding beta-propeller fold protein YncE
MMIDRRRMLGFAAALPVMATGAATAAAAAAGGARCRVNVADLPTRPSGPIEILYKTPHGHPNGLDLTAEGMWVMDQGPDNWISLINPANGSLIREFKPSNVRAASGLCVDEDGTMWVGSTYNRLIVHLDPSSARSIAAFQTPGAGLHYRKVGDPPGRRTTLQHAYPEEPRPPSALPGNIARLPDGQVGLDKLEAPPGTGAHCVLQKGNLLWIAVPDARQVFVIDKTNWIVQDSFDSAGNRPHDMSWTDASKTRYWASDSNLNAFFLQDASTGLMTERIQLPDTSPVVHGAKEYRGYMYCCDDVGWMFRFKM